MAMHGHDVVAGGVKAADDCLAFGGLRLPGTAATAGCWTTNEYQRSNLNFFEVLGIQAAQLRFARLLLDALWLHCLPPVEVGFYLRLHPDVCHLSRGRCHKQLAA